MSMKVISSTSKFTPHIMYILFHHLQLLYHLHFILIPCDEDFSLHFIILLTINACRHFLKFCKYSASILIPLLLFLSLSLSLSLFLGV